MTTGTHSNHFPFFDSENTVEYKMHLLINSINYIFYTINVLVSFQKGTKWKGFFIVVLFLFVDVKTDLCQPYRVFKVSKPAA